MHNNTPIETPINYFEIIKGQWTRLTSIFQNQTDTNDDDENIDEDETENKDYPEYFGQYEMLAKINLNSLCNLQQRILARGGGSNVEDPHGLPAAYSCGTENLLATRHPYTTKTSHKETILTQVLLLSTKWTSLLLNRIAKMHYVEQSEAKMYQLSEANEMKYKEHVRKLANSDSWWFVFDDQINLTFDTATLLAEMLAAEMITMDRLEELTGQGVLPEVMDLLPTASQQFWIDLNTYPRVSGVHFKHNTVAQDEHCIAAHYRSAKIEFSNITCGQHGPILLAQLPASSSLIPDEDSVINRFDHIILALVHEITTLNALAMSGPPEEYDEWAPPLQELITLTDTFQLGEDNEATINGLLFLYQTFSNMHQLMLEARNRKRANLQKTEIIRLTTELSGTVYFIDLISLLQGGPVYTRQNHSQAVLQILYGLNTMITLFTLSFAVARLCCCRARQGETHNQDSKTNRRSCVRYSCVRSCWCMTKDEPEPTGIIEEERPLQE